eukprot:CAMPEP_0194279838 /NCGR_PEP_ID=MMETSP0169-20130528/14155_1 /TAXON_ID=218684 /ORGANISM="Corethron pennatum, Strain L29A3" /LENGTH=162 /DNA_ID=CAMNT_0039024311 /DNA_START=162 /DNA_END=650 /DNA_ORIENTATION=-
MKIHSIIALIAAPSSVVGFAPTFYSRSATKSVSSLNLFGGGGKKDGEEKKGGGMGEMMDNFKKAQEIGAKTQKIQAELAGETLEGLAADGKVVVRITGQQKPEGVDIDPDYLAGVAADELSAQLTTAFQDAHEKSLTVMNEKMMGLYAEMGLPVGAPEPPKE